MLLLIILLKLLVLEPINKNCSFWLESLNEENGSKKIYLLIILLKSPILKPKNKNAVNISTGIFLQNFLDYKLGYI